MKFISLPDFSQEYAYVHNQWGTLAIDEESGKPDTKRLNLCERIGRFFFGSFSANANTRDCVVGSAARKALFNPKYPITKELLDLAKKNFHPQGNRRDEIFLGEEELSSGDTLHYHAFFAPGAKEVLENPRIRITHYSPPWCCGLFGRRNLHNVITLEFSQNTRNPKQIDVKVVTPANQGSLLDRVQKAFLQKLAASKKSAFLKESKELYPKPADQLPKDLPSLEMPVSLDFLLKDQSEEDFAGSPLHAPTTPKSCDPISGKPRYSLILPRDD